jgi:hypothetical protein
MGREAVADPTCLGGWSLSRQNFGLMHCSHPPPRRSGEIIGSSVVISN